MLQKVVKLQDFDFSPYGRCYDLLNDPVLLSHSRTESYEDHMTKAPLIDTLGHLGYTIGGAAPYTVKSMEKHDHTEEALFCAGEPIVLCVAVSRGELPPCAEDVRAVLIEPGFIAVLNRNVWHDACHGIGKSTGYYYLATAGKQPAAWPEISGEPVEVTL